MRAERATTYPCCWTSPVGWRGACNTNYGDSLLNTLNTLVSWHGTLTSDRYPRPTPLAKVAPILERYGNFAALLGQGTADETEESAAIGNNGATTGQRRMDGSA